MKGTLGDSLRGLSFWQDQMREVTATWQSMGVVEKTRFEHLAEMCRDEQQRVLGNDKEHLATALVLLRRRERRRRP